MNQLYARHSTTAHNDIYIKSIINFYLTAFLLQKYLEEYLNGLLENAFCRNDHSMVIALKQRCTHTHTHKKIGFHVAQCHFLINLFFQLEFLSVSALSFVTDLGPKGL